jgi:drug/metabolite transporter (DMT)-like permease
VTITVLLAVLGAAFLHALWNSLVKTGTSRFGAMVVLSVFEVPIGLGVAMTRDLPAPEVWPWVLASGAVHFFYKFFLAQAYGRGDLSRVYPIARGTAPLLVALASGLLLADVITATEFAGIAVLGAGILAMAQGVFAKGEDRRLIPFALATAVAVAAYTLIDGQAMPSDMSPGSLSPMARSLPPSCFCGKAPPCCPATVSPGPPGSWRGRRPMGPMPFRSGP